jgi:hypothetical protein
MTWYCGRHHRVPLRIGNGLADPGEDERTWRAWRQADRPDGAQTLTRLKKLLDRSSGFEFTRYRGSATKRGAGITANSTQTSRL